MTNELKPCPFCGGEAKIVYSFAGCIYMVFCESCGAIVSFKGHESKIGLRRAYNKRGADNG